MIMESEDWPPSEQMQCNTGVIFIQKGSLADNVLKHWSELAPPADLAAWLEKHGG
jgi:hypothetical protein